MSKTKKGNGKLKYLSTKVFIVLCFIFIPQVAHANQPSVQSGTGTYSTSSGGYYSTIGYSLMFGGYTTSVSINDPAVLVSEEDSYPKYSQGFTVKVLSGRERVAEGSIYTLTASGTYDWYNYKIELNPPNFDTNNTVRGRSLLDNLYQEPNVNKTDLTAKLTQGGKAWINAINSGATHWQSHSYMYTGRLWSGGNSNFSIPSRSYETSRIINAFSWSSYTQSVLNMYYDNSYTFPSIPEVDTTPPSLISTEVLDYRYHNGSDYWVRPNDTFHIRYRQFDNESGNYQQNLGFLDGSIDVRSSHKFGSYSTYNSQYKKDPSIVISAANRLENTSYGKVDWTVTAHNNGSNYDIRYLLTDNSRNNNGWASTGLRLRVDGQNPWVSYRTGNGANVYNSQPWHNGNIQVMLKFGDSGSGYKESRYKWTQSTSTPSTWSNWTSNNNYVLNYNTSGKWYLHVQVQDNVGNTLTTDEGPYEIDTIAPQNQSETYPVLNAPFVNGSDYWFRPGQQGYIQLKQYDPLSGNNKQYLRLYGSGQDIRSQHLFSGSSTNNNQFMTSTHAVINSADRLQNTAIGEVKWGVVPKVSGDNYDIEYYYRDNVANIIGYYSTGKHLRVDGEAPKNVSEQYPVLNSPYVNGNDYWFRPGQQAYIQLKQYDPLSGNNKQYLRLYGSGQDIRSQHLFSGSSTNNNQFMTSTHAVINSADRLQNTATGEVKWGVIPKTNGDNYDIQYYYRDNVGNIIGYYSIGKHLRVDGVAPTVSASPTSKGWTNSNISVALSASDSGSGVKIIRYNWSQSTSTPSSWYTYSSTVTQSSEGTWYLHYKVLDKVGNIRTGYFGPYRIDKTGSYRTTTSINGARYVNSNRYYFKPGDQVTLKLRATDALSGVRYIATALMNSDVAKADHDWANGYGHAFGTWTHWSFVSQSSTYSSGNTKEISVVAKANPTSSAFSNNYDYYILDNAGNTVGYNYTGADVDIDGYTPIHSSASISGDSYTNGGVHWASPNDTITLTNTGYELGSGMNYNISVLKPTNDTSVYMYGKYNFRDSTSVNGGTWTGLTYSSMTGSYSNSYYTTHLTIKPQSTTGTTKYNFYDRYRDNVGNDSYDLNTGLQLGIDGTPPAVKFRNSADTSDFTSRNWSTNTIQVRLKFSDSGSGYKQSRYAWTQSTSTPSSWSSWSTNSDYTVNQASYGQWYLHVQGQDNVGNTVSTYEGPYDLSDVPVSGFTASPNPTDRLTNVNITSSAYDPHNASLIYNYAYQMSGSTTWTTISTAANPSFKLPKVGAYLIRQTVTNTYNESDTTIQTVTVKDLLPTPGFTVSPSIIYEGDKMTILSSASDPEGDTLSYRYTITKPNGSVITYKTGDPQVNSNGDLVIKTNSGEQGNWTIKQYVSDGLSTEVNMTKSINVRGLSITGSVGHTARWLSYHQNNGQPLSDFYSGEEFVLKANVSPVTISSVTVSLNGTRIDGTQAYLETTLSESSSTEYTGSIYDNSFLDPTTRLQNGLVKFTFTVTYSNGTIKSDTVDVNIIGSAYEALKLHRTY